MTKTDEITLNKLAGYRVMLGFTQESFGEIFGMSKQHYGQKENGRRNFNDKEKVKIQKYLSKYFPDVTIEELFF